MPKKYVIDAVEILKNSSKGIDLATKRLYDDLDAGYTNIEAASGYTGEIMYRNAAARTDIRFCRTPTTARWTSMYQQP